MGIWTVAGEISFIILIVFFVSFAVFSLLEREKKAFQRSLFFLLLLICINSFLFFIPLSLKNWIFGSVFIVIATAFIILIFSPSPKRKTEIVGEQKQIDERDVIFARFDYIEGSEIFKEYYKQNTNYKKIDDEIRKLPDILSSSHVKKSPLFFSLANAEFDFLEAQLTNVKGVKGSERIELSPHKNTKVIKNVIRYLGSDICGICELDKSYLYSNVGRGPEQYGEKIENNDKYAVVFAVEMDYEMIRTSPKSPVIVETAKKYVETAKISIIAANFIRRLGYSSRAHIAGSNYQAMLVPLAWKAGLGELGRMGILVTKKFGSRVRLGLVTTDLPLIVDRPENFGVQDFCAKCQKCARNCPAQAITYGKKVKENGVLKWVINREECYRFWRKVGTDCATCVFVCPYSKPDNLFHNLIRKVISKSSTVHSSAIFSDDLFYGRKPQNKKSPLDL